MSNSVTSALITHLYNSCRMGTARNASRGPCPLLEARKAELLPVEYFHVVFTLPNTIADMLCKTSVSSTTCSPLRPMRRCARSLPTHGTWEWKSVTLPSCTPGTNLLITLIHCVVPGGGLSWTAVAGCVHAKALFYRPRFGSRYFRNAFLRGLQNAFEAALLTFFRDSNVSCPTRIPPMLNKHRKTEWSSAKRPFGGPEQVVEYLGRYTHRVAISNNRLVNVSHDQVCFRWRDYRTSHRNAP